MLYMQTFGSVVCVEAVLDKLSKTASTHITLPKVYQVRLLSCKTNITSSPEFGGRACEPGDKLRTEL